MALDRISIEHLLIWAYQDQRVDKLFGQGVGMFPAERLADGHHIFGVSGDGCALIERRKMLGCVIDGGAGLASGGTCHPDAEAAHEAVMTLPSRIARAVVIECAKTGQHPDWMPGARPYMEPVLAPNGRRKGQPVRILDKNNHWIGCQITIGLAQETIDTARAYYDTWRQALVELMAALNDRLVSHSLIGLKSPYRPWLTSTDQSALDIAKLS